MAKDRRAGRRSLRHRNPHPAGLSLEWHSGHVIYKGGAIAMSTLCANPLGSDRCHTRCRLHVARGISLPDMLKRKLAMSIERFEAVVDRMTELHGEQDAADGGRC